MGVSSDNGSNSDLEAAMAGGSTFEQRLAELAAAKQSLAEAYTDLNVGRSAKEAAAAAAKDKSDAELMLENAKKSAAETLRKANDEALVIERRAKLRSEEMIAACSADVEAKSAEAQKLLAAAKLAKEEAAAALAEASAKMKSAKEIADQAEDNKKRAQDAADAYAEESEKLKSIREKVLAALALI